MSMVRHDNDSVQVELGAVFLKAAFEHNISGIGWKDPAMVCGEGNEDRPVIFLDVRKTAAIVIPRLHKTIGPLGRVTGSKTRSHTDPGSTQIPVHRSQSYRKSAQLLCQQLIHHLRIRSE